MSKASGKERITRRVSFTAEEDRQIRERAKKSGVLVSAYIRQQA